MFKYALIILTIFAAVVLGTVYFVDAAHGETDDRPPVMTCPVITSEKTTCRLDFSDYDQTTDHIRVRIYFNGEWLMTNVFWPNELLEEGEIIVK